ncbi:HypC/HybG/HupF family hydrogenase formation chaperone [Candidatus Poribacteria bacterium]|nr:HypC/HybG/HupF family hydrogenase formation chaperone [Candidatus Poribacteria bacterium]
MCLAIPGKIIEVTGPDSLLRPGTVSFGGILKEVSLAYVPEAVAGDFVLVHAGFALNRLDEEEADRVFRALAELGAVGEEIGGSG